MLHLTPSTVIPGHVHVVAEGKRPHRPVMDNYKRELHKEPSREFEPSDVNLNSSYRSYDIHSTPERPWYFDLDIIIINI